MFQRLALSLVYSGVNTLLLPLNPLESTIAVSIHSRWITPALFPLITSATLWLFSSHHQ
jgi:hypothetical protein